MFYNTLVSTPQRWVSHISLCMSEDHSSARGFGPEPLDLAYSVELDPNIVELDVHGTNGMEDRNGVEDYGMQESGIWDNHLEDNGM